MKQAIKKYWLEILVFFIISFLFLFKVTVSHGFDSDFGRDLTWMYDIIHGKHTLLGPKLSFGGYYVGPYYYYLFVPFLAFAKLNPAAIVIANSFLFIFCTGFIFFVLKKKNNAITRPIFILGVSLSAYFLFSARSVGNGFSYLGPLLSYMLLIIEAKDTSLKKQFLWGLIGGFIFNIHPISSLAFIPLVLIKIILQSRKFIDSLKQLITYSLGFVILLMPTIFFELRHGFIMTKNTFINKSYLLFINNLNLSEKVVTSKNPFINLININSLVSFWFSFPFVFLVIFLCVIYFLSKKSKNLHVFLSLVTTVVLYASLLRFQISFHYLFPLLLTVQVSSYYLMKDFNKSLLILFLILQIFLNLIKFPKSLFKPTSRDYKKISIITKTAVEKLKLPKENLNLVVIQKTPIAILGYEYRYILRTINYKTESEFSYKTNKYLLMISELGNFNWKNFSSWEINEFGEKKLINTFHKDNYYFYLFQKINI